MKSNILTWYHAQATLVARSPNAALPQEQKRFTQAIQLCDSFIFASAGAPSSIVDLKAAVAQALTQTVSIMDLKPDHNTAAMPCAPGQLVWADHQPTTCHLLPLRI
jgi:hypothetical protein